MSGGQIPLFRASVLQGHPRHLGGLRVGCKVPEARRGNNPYAASSGSLFTTSIGLTGGMSGGGGVVVSMSGR